MNFPFSRKSPITVAVSLLTLGIVPTPSRLHRSLKPKMPRSRKSIVTARKRQESLQDVPVAVTALTPNQLERGVPSSEQLTSIKWCPTWSCTRPILDQSR